MIPGISSISPKGPNKITNTNPNLSAVGEIVSLRRQYAAYAVNTAPTGTRKQPAALLKLNTPIANIVKIKDSNSRTKKLSIQWDNSGAGGAFLIS